MMTLPPLGDSMHDVLAVAEHHFVAANPLSRERHKEASNVMPGGNTRTSLFYSPFPIAFADGQDQHLTDLDGHEYVDLLGEYSAGLYGHSPAPILDAVRSVLDAGIAYGGPNVYESELAHAIVERFPSVDLLRFTNSGTEANLFAIGAARAVTGRGTVIVFESGYHGGVLSFRGEAPLNAPYPFVVCDFNDVDGTLAAIEANADDLAAVILEPMLGGGGAIAATTDFVQALREATTRVGAVLILDEVMTSRLGPSGLQQKYDVVPDMTTFGKYLGGGFSFGAFGGAAWIMDRFDPSSPTGLSHPGTFNNNTATMAAGLAGLREMFTPEVAVTHNLKGDRLRDRLNSVFAESDIAAQATGVGSILAIHFQRSAITSGRDIEPATQKRALLHLELIRRGFYIARRGYLALSLPVTDGDVDDFVEAVRDVVDTHRELLV
jgi:glutamate-1-semialdehyde 2,1-aminomutase